jgi:NADH-quinone oxidoreductase subunit G
MCDEGRLTYHPLREHRLAGATVDGLPAGWDRAIRAAADHLTPMLAASRQAVGVVLSAESSNEDNFALGKLAKAWGVTGVYVAARPDVPGRADGRLRVADVNPNRRGVQLIAEALGLGARPVAELSPDVRCLVMLGAELPGVAPARLAELELIAITPFERAAAASAKIALPSAAWAEAAGTVTTAAGLVQRMHAALPAPGQALPAWEAIVRLASIAAGAGKLSFTHVRDVFKDMTQTVPAWSALTWAREARPLELRFAGSRG